MRHPVNAATPPPRECPRRMILCPSRCSLTRWCTTFTFGRRNSRRNRRNSTHRENTVNCWMASRRIMDNDKLREQQRVESKTKLAIYANTQHQGLATSPPSGAILPLSPYRNMPRYPREAFHSIRLLLLLRHTRVTSCHVMPSTKRGRHRTARGP